MRIGELAKAAKCTTETIRFYEKEGLLPDAGRTESNYRSFGPAHVERLRFIRNCRAFDMSHGEIRALLEAMDASAGQCGPVNDVLDQHLAHVDARIEQLRQLRAQLATLRGQCQTERPVEDCGILQGLASMETQEEARGHSHLG